MADFSFHFIPQSANKTNWINPICFVLGMMLTLWLYIFNRSLWLDEAMLANNILNRNIVSLLQPLDDYQSAPPLYLILTKIVAFLNQNDWALKIPVILAYSLATILWIRFLNKGYNHPLISTIGIGLFVFNFILLRYSTELKPYMFDVLITIAIIPLTLKLTTSPIPFKQKLCFLLIAIPSIFLSAISPILLMYPVVHSFLVDLKNRKTPWFGSTLICCIAIYYFAFVYNHPHTTYMVDYWENANGFIPFGPNKINSLFSQLFLFGKTSSYLLFGLILIGLFALFQKRQFTMTLVLLLPFFLHGILSGLKMYPIDVRFCLYFIPLIAIIICEGVNYLWSLPYLLSIKLCTNKLAFLLPILLIYKLFQNPLPIRIEEIKDVLYQMKTNVHLKDNIYVYYGSAPTVKYYAKVGLTFNTNNLTYGTKHRNNPNLYEKEIPLDKNRLWFICSHVFNKESEIIEKAIESQGYFLKSRYQSKGAEAMLFIKDSTLINL